MKDNDKVTLTISQIKHLIKEANSSNMARFEKTFEKLNNFEDWFDGTFKWTEWDKEMIDYLDAPIVNSVCDEVEKAADAFRHALNRLIDHIGK